MAFPDASAYSQAPPPLSVLLNEMTGLPDNNVNFSSRSAVPLDRLIGLMFVQMMLILCNEGLTVTSLTKQPDRLALTFW